MNKSEKGRRTDERSQKIRGRSDKGDRGFRVSGLDFGVEGSFLSFQGVVCSTQGSGFKIQGSELRVQGSGFRVYQKRAEWHTLIDKCLCPNEVLLSGFGIRVQGLEFEVWGFAFRVSGESGVRVRISRDVLDFRGSGRIFGLVHVLFLSVSGFGFRVQGFRFWVLGSGLGIQGLRLRVNLCCYGCHPLWRSVHGAISPASGFMFEVWKLVFRVKGLGCLV